MRYSKADALREVQRRETEIRKKKYRQGMSILGGTSLLLTTAIVSILFLISGGIEGGITAGRNYGTLLLKAGAGGYVLAAVAAFIAGALITILCVRYKKRHPNRK